MKPFYFFIFSLILFSCREDAKFQNVSPDAKGPEMTSNAMGKVPAPTTTVTIPAVPITPPVKDSGVSLIPVQNTIKEKPGELVPGEASVTKEPLRPSGCSMGPSTLPSGGFKDLTGTFYEKDVEAAARLAIVAGYPGEPLFKPGNGISREEFTIVVLKSLHCLPNIKVTVPDTKSIPADTVIFLDVPNTHWSAPSILTAKNLGLVAGYPKIGAFKPGNEVTNGEMFAIVMQAIRYARVQNKMSAESPKFTTTAPFTDIKGNWAEDPVVKLFGFCQVAQPLNRQGTLMKLNDSAPRDYATSAVMRMRQCLMDELGSVQG